MKPRTLALFLAAMAVLLLLWAMWPAGGPPETGRAENHAGAPTSRSASTTVTNGPGAHRTRSAAQHGVDSSLRPWSDEPAEASAAPLTMARVDTAQVLAMVNQTPLRLRDLMPVGPRETSKALSPEQYHSRLQRAIEMELTFQAAHSQGAELTGAQQQRVEQIAEDGQLEPEGYENRGLSWSSIGQEHLDFEKRVLAAQMLEQNLVSKQAGVSPSTDPQMQARYEQARSELLDQLRAKANITKAVTSL